MSRLRFGSTCRMALAIPLIVAAVVRVPLADGLLLHDHGEQGLHSHTVTLDDLCEGDLRASWHRHHDHTHHGDHDHGNTDSDGGEYADSLFIFVNSPAIATGVHCSSDTVIASNRRPSFSVWPRSMLPSDSSNVSRFLAAPWPPAHSLRPVFALDALLQSSQALLL